MVLKKDFRLESPFKIFYLSSDFIPHPLKFRPALTCRIIKRPMLFLNPMRDYRAIHICITA